MATKRPRKTKADWEREIIDVRNKTLLGMFIVCVFMTSVSQCDGYNRGYQAGQKSVQQDKDSAKTEVRKAELPQYFQNTDTIKVFQRQR